MDRRRLPVGVPAVRLASRLQVGATYTSDTSRRSARRGSGGGQPPALTVDVRVVIRRHFPAAMPGGARRIVVEKVAADIALRRRPSRKLRGADSVERALVEEVLPLVAHPFDRGAVSAAAKEISARVAAACGDPRIARGGARVLVMVDTFACPAMAFRRPGPPPPLKVVPRNVVACVPEKFVAGAATQRVGLETAIPSKKTNPYGVIGDRRPKKVVEEGSKLEGWTPMAGCSGLTELLGSMKG